MGGITIRAAIDLERKIMQLAFIWLSSYMLFSVFTVNISHALTKEQEKIINYKINIMKESCGIISKKKDIDFSANTNLSLIIKNLPGANIGGDAKYKYQEAEGFASNLQKEITSEGVNLSQKQLECTQKFGLAIYEDLSQLLKMNSTPVPTNTEALRKEGFTPTLERRDFVLTEGASEILTEDQNIFTLNRVVRRADTDFVQIKLDGQNIQLSAGMSTKVGQSKPCRVTLLEILPRQNSVLFNIRCQH